ncbi:hypothetical protein [Chelativorans alearense]|uniref:hypothetical protein n=1 Tax=Chelativorans alearense TaxID=2681495 RepID=UPI0013D10AF7|nr:hypothetical protein [Chelativorans alearense]
MKVAEHQRQDRQTMRELTAEEIACVTGGQAIEKSWGYCKADGTVVTYYQFDTGDVDVRTTKPQ